MRDVYCGAPTHNISPECAMLIFDMISVDWRLRPTIEDVLKDQWVSGFTSHRQRRILRGPGNKNFPLPFPKGMRDAVNNYHDANNILSTLLYC